MESFPIPPPAFRGDSHRVPADDAFDWLRQGWALFIAHPRYWLLFSFVTLFSLSTLLWHPTVGVVCVLLLMPLAGATGLEVCRRISVGDSLAIARVFAGLQAKAPRLLVIGVTFATALLAIGSVVVSGYYFGFVRHFDSAGLLAAVIGFLCASLLLLVLFIPVFMAFWFIPALVLFNGMRPLNAAQASYSACRKNMPAFLAYAALVVTLAVFATLPAGIGLIVLFPILAGSVYASYQDVFLAH